MQTIEYISKEICCFIPILIFFDCSGELRSRTSTKTIELEAGENSIG